MSTADSTGVVAQPHIGWPWNAASRGKEHQTAE